MAGKGLADLTKNLNAAIKKIEGNSKEGLQAAAIYVQGESQQLAPVEFSVLRNSAFNDISVTGTLITARAGYTAKYAPFIHEMPMKNPGKPRKGKGHKGVYWQDGENKFLEKPIRQDQAIILQIIANRAKLK